MTMKKIKFVGVFILALFLLTSCGAKGDVLGKDDNGKQVNFSVGEQFSVVLESNPTTGYRWEVGEIDRTKIKQLGAEYDADSKSPLIVGSGGAEIFTFEAVGAGETTLTLVYRRSWEDVEPVETFSVKVVVE